MALNNPKPIIVIGAGWSGLTCAYSLNHHFPVILLEAAPQAGGRARTVSLNEQLLDNGQHLCVGAYGTLLQLLTKLDIAESTVFHRTPFHLRILNPKGINTSIQSLGKHRFSLISALLRAKGYTLNEKMHIFKFIKYILWNPLPSDMPVDELLHKCKQPQKLIETLWEPLALAALTTPVNEASSQCFIQVLTRIFASNSNSDWLFPRKDLSELFPNQILKKLPHLNTSIRYHERVENLSQTNDKTLLVTTNKSCLEAQAVILATPPHAAAKILEHSTIGDHSKITERLNQIRYEPITTVYLEYKEPVSLETPMIGLNNCMSQWVFDRSFCDQPNLISVIISSSGKHHDHTHDELSKIISEELAQQFPHLKKPINSKVICEKRAAFSCTPGYHQNQIQNSVGHNIWIAGDYTHPLFPATLEGAVESGLNVAREVNAFLGRSL